MKKNDWDNIYQLRDMINYCKRLRDNSCDDDEVELYEEMIQDYEFRITELKGV